MSEFNKYSTDGGATFIDVEDSNAVHWGDQSKGYVGKNLIYKTLVGYAITGNESIGYGIEASANGFDTIAKVKQNTNYIASKATIGNRFSIYGFVNEPYAGMSNEVGSHLIYRDDTKTSYEFNSGSYNYIVFQCNNINSYSGDMDSMIRLASIPDSTYEPWYMSNRELTEVVPHTLTPHSDITLTAYDCWISGNVGYMSVNMTTNASISSETTVLTLDKNLFNRTHSCSVYIGNERLDQIDTFFDFDGKNVNTKQSIASGKTIRFTTMFMR